jgi:hypothetical protein
VVAGLRPIYCLRGSRLICPSCGRCNSAVGSAMHSLRLHGERIVKFSPTTGAVSWECSTWDSVRSDSHQICVRVTPDALMVKGSPARVIGDGDAAFSSGAARALDLPGCVERMARFVGGALAVTVPTVACWSINRPASLRAERSGCAQTRSAWFTGATGERLATRGAVSSAPLPFTRYAGNR